MQKVSSDPRFEVSAPPHLGLVCFRLRGRPNRDSERLNDGINEEGKIHITPSKIGDTYFLRYQKN